MSESVATYCNSGNHDGNFKSFFRAQGWVSCQECCEKMTKIEYKNMIDEHCK